MQKDISTTLGLATAIPAASYEADNTPDAVDIRMFKAVVIGIMVGVGGVTFDDTDKIEFKLTHSDDDDSYEAVAQGDVEGVTVGTGGIVKSLVAAHAAATLTKVGYHGGKRYLKLLADFSGTHTDLPTPIAAFVVQGEPLIAPV